MMRKAAILTGILLAGCSSGLWANEPEAASKTSRPNILLITVDDLKPTLGCYGDPIADTPNIDTLANSGIIFENAHCQQAVCTASRASMLTGKYPDSIQLWDLKTKIRQHNPDIITLPQYFKNNGYTTVAVGKVFDRRNVDEHHDALSWSIEHQTPHTGTEYQYANPDHYSAMQGLEQAGKLQKNRTTVLKKHGLTPPTEIYDTEDNDYPDAKIAMLGVQHIEALSQQQEPFFLAVGFLRPHLPFAAPEKYWNLYERDQFTPHPVKSLPKDSPHFAFQDSWELRWAYSGIPGNGKPLSPELQQDLIHGYYACVSFIDAQVGYLIAALDEHGLRENTIIVLLGDHGFHLGDHGMWCKHTNYEQATRAPLIFAGPEIPKNTQSMAPVELIDIYPTLCDLTDLPEPTDIEGMSLAPLFKEPETDVRFAAQSQFPRNKGKQKLMGYSYRSREHRYIEWRDRNSGKVIASEFFDYETDPFEHVNLIGASEYNDTLENFKAEIEIR